MEAPREVLPLTNARCRFRAERGCANRARCRARGLPAGKGEMPGVGLSVCLAAVVGISEAALGGQKRACVLKGFW